MHSKSERILLNFREIGSEHMFQITQNYLKHVFTPISRKFSKMFLRFLGAYILLNQIQKIITLWIKRAYDFKTPNNYILVAFE